MEDLERVATPASFAIFLLGLLFIAAGFGTFVAGHLEGLLVVFVGVAMFWAGWVGSQPRGLSCLGAALLNMLDASITLATWSHEINPIVLGTGPTLFIAAKLLCSAAIVLFARSIPNPSKGGYILSSAFAFILAWNLSQLALFSAHAQSLTRALFWGTSASAAVAFATLMLLAFRRGRIAL
jgi:hypothetical protein